MKGSITKILVMLALACLVIGADARGSSKERPPNAPTDKNPRAYKGFTKEQIDAVKAGEIVIMDKLEEIEGRYMVTSLTMFNQDIDTVFNLINQGWRHPEFQPALKNDEPLEKWDTGFKIDCRVEIWFFDVEWREVIKWGKEPYYRVNDLDPEYDNDFKVLSGRWQFFWVDDKHTLGRNSTWMEPNFPIPKSILGYLIKSDLPNAYNNLRLWIDSGGTYRYEEYEEPDK